MSYYKKPRLYTAVIYGKTMTLTATDWEQVAYCKQRGIYAQLIRARVVTSGWSDQDAVTIPAIRPEEKHLYNAYSKKKKPKPSPPTDERPLTPQELYAKVQQFERDWRHLM